MPPSHYGKKPTARGHGKQVDHLSAFRDAFQKDHAAKKNSGNAADALELKRSKEDSDLKSFEESLDKLLPKKLSSSQLKDFDIDFDPEAVISSDEEYQKDIAFVDEDLDSKRGMSVDEVIKDGISKGYPEKINYRRIRKFTRRNIAHARNVLNSKVKSNYYDKAKTRIAGSPLLEVTQTAAIANDWIPQPGYYGQRGWETVSAILHKELSDEVEQAMKHEPWCKMTQGNIYFDMVLVPELMVKLYQKEQDMSRKEAIKLLDESSGYGRLKFRDIIEDDSGDSDYEDEFEIAEHLDVREESIAPPPGSKVHTIYEHSDDGIIARTTKSKKRRKKESENVEKKLKVAKHGPKTKDGNSSAPQKSRSSRSDPKSNNAAFQKLFLIGDDEEDDASDDSLKDEFD